MSYDARTHCPCIDCRTRRGEFDANRFKATAEPCEGCPDSITGGQGFGKGVVAREAEKAFAAFKESAKVQPTLSTDPALRKEVPIATCVIDYFPLALAAVAAVSRSGQLQHGTTGWDRSKSSDESDALMRHFMERGTRDTDGHRHSAKVAWRALALLQKELEADREPPC